jgi:hypothetical protein
MRAGNIKSQPSPPVAPGYGMDINRMGGATRVVTWWGTSTASVTGVVKGSSFEISTVPILGHVFCEFDLPLTT